MSTQNNLPSSFFYLIVGESDFSKLAFSIKCISVQLEVVMVVQTQYMP